MKLNSKRFLCSSLALAMMGFFSLCGAQSKFSEVLLDKETTQYARGYPYKKSSCTELYPKLIIGEGDSGNIFDGAAACVANGHLDWVIWEHSPYKPGDLNAGDQACYKCQILTSVADEPKFQAKIIGRSSGSLVMKGYFGSEKTLAAPEFPYKKLECYEDCIHTFDEYEGIIELNLTCSHLVDTISGSLSVNGLEYKITKSCDTLPESCTSRLEPDYWTNGNIEARVKMCSDPEKCVYPGSTSENVEIPEPITQSGESGQAKIRSSVGEELECEKSPPAKIDTQSPLLVGQKNPHHGLVCQQKSGQKYNLFVFDEENKPWFTAPLECEIEVKDDASGIASVTISGISTDEKKMDQTWFFPGDGEDGMIRLQFYKSDTDRWTYTKDRVTESEKIDFLKLYPQTKKPELSTEGRYILTESSVASVPLVVVQGTMEFNPFPAIKNEIIDIQDGVFIFNGLVTKASPSLEAPHLIVFLGTKDASPIKSQKIALPPFEDANRIFENVKIIIRDHAGNENIKQQIPKFALKIDQTDPIFQAIQCQGTEFKQAYFGEKEVWVNQNVDCVLVFTDPLPSIHSGLKSYDIQTSDSSRNPIPAWSLNGETKDDEPLVSSSMSFNANKKQTYFLSGSLTDKAGNRTIFQDFELNVYIDKAAPKFSDPAVEMSPKGESVFRSLSTESQIFEAHEMFILKLNVVDQGEAAAVSGIDWSASTLAIEGPVTIPETAFDQLDKKEGFRFIPSEKKLYISKASSLFQKSGNYTLRLNIQDHAGNPVPDQETPNLAIKIVPSEAITASTDDQKLPESCQNGPHLANHTDTCEIKIRLYDRFGNSISNRGEIEAYFAKQNISQTLTREAPTDQNLLTTTFINGLRFENGEIRRSEEAMKRSIGMALLGNKPELSLKVKALFPSWIPQESDEIKNAPLQSVELIILIPQVETDGQLSDKKNELVVPVDLRFDPWVKAEFWENEDLTRSLETFWPPKDTFFAQVFTDEKNSLPDSFELEITKYTSDNSGELQTMTTRLPFVGVKARSQLAPLKPEKNSSLLRLESRILYQIDDIQIGYPLGAWGKPTRKDFQLDTAQF